MNRKTRVVLTALLVVGPTTGPTGAAEVQAGPAPPRYVASGGLIYEWDGSSPRVAPAEPRGDLPEGPVTQVLQAYADGERLLLLMKSVTGAGKGRGRHEGLSLILDVRGTAPRALHQIPLDGEPYDLAINPDDSRAYVLARHLTPGENAVAGRFWIHEIDLQEGRLLGSAQLSSEPSGIAVQPDGRRLFVTIVNRIQSFTTDPLISSWHYRSPGPNRDLVIRSGDGTLCVARGEEVALFNPAAIAARADSDRRARTDDASTVVRLPFEARALDLSEDGRVAAVLGSDRLAYLDCATQALIWPVDPPPGLAGAAQVRTLAFPAAGGDLVMALFPAGEVLGFRTPAPAPSVQQAAKPTAAEPTPAETRPAEPAPPQEAPNSTALADAAPSKAEPAAASPAAAAPSVASSEVPAPSTPAPPEPGPPEPATLSGRIKGDRSRVEAIVLYGPNSIVKEFGRVRPAADGAWKAALPPPGIYRLVPVAGAPTPLPASPAFLTVKVAVDEGQSGLDFEIGGG
ncbi:MAG TPA: hypothetical protein VFB95_11050 [Candidatus Cryosericum sp.]|nr:hypothetical protein [Candidatus Cryosericum sp.]